MTTKLPRIMIELLNMKEDGWTIVQVPEGNLQVAPKSLI